MNKLIGISPRVLVYENREKIFTNIVYIKYLESHNFLSLILPLHPSDELLDKFDGFLIPGGDDIDPKHYNEPINEKTVISGSNVDETDLKIINYVKQKKKPLLGICRGLQIINVAFSGSLTQHIDNHIQKTKLINHDIKLSKGRIFNLSKDIVNVNSSHHQAINILGEGLKAVAASLDNIVEIIEHESLPILAVQFHPELMTNKEVPELILESYYSLFK